jgi:hypothetical protein
MGAAKRAEAKQAEYVESDEPHTTPPSLDVATPKAANAPERPVDFEPSFDPPSRMAKATTAVDPEHEKRFGPYAAVYHPDTEPPYFSAPQAPRVRRPPPPPLPEADVTVKAANSNTAATTAPISEIHPATVVTIPRPAQPRHRVENEGPATVRDEPLASVTLQRETATFTVPVSEAVIPASLKDSLAQFSGHRVGTPKDWRELPTIASKPEETHLWEQDQPRSDQDPLSASDKALIRRIAPPAAE